MTQHEKHQKQEETCRGCRYYQEYEDFDEAEMEGPDDLTGICRRYPPVCFPSLTPMSVYPDVASTGWCGEFLPAAAES